MIPTSRRSSNVLFASLLVPFVGFVPLLGACSSDSSPPPAPVVEKAGQPCTSAAECYSGLDGSALMGGAAVCIDKVTGGYCTHVCTVDTDCCAVPGECRTAHPQVCAPFESTGQMYCFLSCEDVNLADSGQTDANAYCGAFAYTGFGCRSTGGGSQNRKICAP